MTEERLLRKSKASDAMNTTSIPLPRDVVTGTADAAGACPEIVKEIPPNVTTTGAGRKSL
jgi:hypothetical protein